MAWATFPTLTDGQILTGAHMQIIKGNFDASPNALITDVGQIVVGTSANVMAARKPDWNSVLTSQTTTSTSFVDLATVGPQVVVTTGARQLVLWGCQLTNSGVGFSYMSFSGGGNTASASFAVQAASTAVQASYTFFGTLATPGSNTFTAKYSVSSGTGTFQDRRMQVVPFS